MTWLLYFVNIFNRKTFIKLALIALMFFLAAIFIYFSSSKETPQQPTQLDQVSQIEPVTATDNSVSIALINEIERLYNENNASIDSNVSIIYIDWLW